MKLDAWQFRWMMNLYPPLMLNGVRIIRLSSDYRQMTVRVRPGLLNRNLQGSIFGGSLFSAFDPYYPVMLWQILAREGIATQAWLRAAEINYLFPARSRMTILFKWTEEEINEAKLQLMKTGKYKGWHFAEAKNSENKVCATCRLLVILKTKGLTDDSPGF